MPLRVRLAALYLRLAQRFAPRFVVNHARDTWDRPVVQAWFDRLTEVARG